MRTEIPRIRAVCFWLSKESMHVLPLIVGRTKTAQICGQGLASLAVTNLANLILRLISGLTPNVGEFVFA